MTSAARVRGGVRRADCEAVAFPGRLRTGSDRVLAQGGVGIEVESEPGVELGGYQAISTRRLKVTKQAPATT